MPWLRTDGRWSHEERIAPGPKGRITGYGKTAEAALADAKGKAEKALAALEETSTPIFQEPDKFPPGSFAVFAFTIWWPHVKPGLTAPSRRKYNSLLKHHVLPALGRLPIETIGFGEITAMMAGLKRSSSVKLKKGAPLSKKQRSEVLSRAKEILELHRSLRQAQGLFARDDWRLVKAPPGSSNKKKARKEPPADFTMKLLEHCRPHEVGPHFAALFLGLRRGEVCGFQWSKIDRAGLVVTVSEQLQPETGEELVPVKGGEDKSRTIPITAEILAMIDELGDHTSDFVFTAPRPGKGNHRKGYVPPIKPWLPNQLTKATPAICERAELPKAGFHDLRSYAASNLSALGLELPAIMEILGHGDIDVTMLYINARNEVKRAGLRRLFQTLQNPQTDVPKALDGRA